MNPIESVQRKDSTEQRDRALGLARVALVALSMTVLAACGNSGGGGSDTPTFGGGGGGGGGASAEAMAAFQAQNGVFDLVRTNCSTCHSGAGPGTPAISHPDAGTAYNTILANQKVNFSDPGQSRLVRRLVADFHYCWNDCVMDGAMMQAGIEAWAIALQSGSGGGGTQVTGLVSTSAAFSDGFEPQGGDRYEDSVIAKWEFKEETGTTAFDTSGVAPAMDLTLSGDAALMSNHGVTMTDGKAQAEVATSAKLYNAVADVNTGSQQYSLELWVAPMNIVQGDNNGARIATYANGANNHNMTLDQREYNFEVMNRNLSLAQGNPSLLTADADQDAQAALQHVVVTYDQYRGRRIYVDGVFTDDMEAEDLQPLWNWDPTYRFALGNAAGNNNNRDWEGDIRFAAVFPFVLTDAQIVQNFNAGIGKRLLIRFDTSAWAGPGTYVEFIVSELDEFSYLFCEPRFVTPTPNGSRIGNLRINVNGVVPVSGQGFVNVDTIVTATSQELSRGCSVILKDQGPNLDVFTIEFEYLAGFTDPVPPPDPGSPPPPVFDPVGFPTEGFRNFERINESFAAVTGIDPARGDITSVYMDSQDALPNGPDLRQFSSATEVAISKLAIEYCEVLISDEIAGTPNQKFTPARAYFPGFNWNDAAAFQNAATQASFVQELTDNMAGQVVPNQPTMAEILTILQMPAGVFDVMNPPPSGSCVADCPNTGDIARGVCTAVLASAAVSVH